MTEPYVPQNLQFCKLNDQNIDYNIVDNNKQPLYCNKNASKCIKLNFNKIFFNNISNIRDLDQNLVDSTSIPCSFDPKGRVAKFSDIDVNQYKFANYNISSYPYPSHSNILADIIKPGTTLTQYSNYDLNAILNNDIYFTCNLEIDSANHVNLGRLKQAHTIATGLFTEANPKVYVDYLESIKPKVNEPKEEDEDEDEDEHEDEDEEYEEDEEDEEKSNTWLYFGIALLAICLFLLIFGILFMANL
jgi:hypothetical protein